MRRVVIPGGSYGEAHPNGVYAVLVGNDVVVTDGLVRENPFGSDRPLHLRCSSAGTFAGQGHDSGRVIRWTGAQWLAEGTTCGVNSVCFAPDGALHVNDHCQHGTQGIRWIEPDGQIVTGDATYDGRGTTGMAEWTQRGNVTVGQSYVDGCSLRLDGDIPRQLEPGHCTFVRFNRAGDRLAVALWKQLEHCAVLFWFDVSEIAALPPEPTVIDPDPTDPPIDPEPFRMFMSDNVYATIKAFYDKFGLPEGEQAQREHHGRCCQTVKARHFGGWGWKRADPNRPPSADAIAFRTSTKLYIWDCVFDAGGPDRRFSLQPGTEGQDATGQVFIDVEPHDYLEGAGPDPDPDPGTVPAAVEARIRQLIMESEVRTGQQIIGVANGASEAVDALRGRVSALEQKPPAAFDPSQYDVKIDVGRNWSHSHSATGKLVKKESA